MLFDDEVRSAENAPKTANKYVMHGTPGVGKTTFWANAPNVLFIPAMGEESGISKLATAGLVPATVKWLREWRRDSAEKKGVGWTALLSKLSQLAKEEHSYTTIVLDCADDEGFLSYAYNHHGEQEYGGDMGDAGFMSFQKGYTTVNSEIKRLTHGVLQRLVNKGIDVVLLMHSTVGTYKNPSGLDYTRHIPLAQQKTVWPMVQAWADIILFLDSSTTIVEPASGKGKGKAKGGARRILYCENRATHEAKNRHGLPASLALPEDESMGYATLMAAMKGDKVG